jgi:solute carrier family 41
LKIIDLVKFDFILYPDNIATPIAASMGDICTITILALISDFLFKLSEENQWLSGTALFVILLSAPLMGFIARRNRYTKSVILSGWAPILVAVIIEQPRDIVMDKASDKYNVISTFQSLVNGIKFYRFKLTQNYKLNIFT